MSMFVNYDNELGTCTKPPRLERVEDFTNWKDRMRSFCYYSDAPMWTSIQQGSHIPMLTIDNGLVRNNDQVSWTEEDRKLIMRYFRALGALKVAIITLIYNAYGLDKFTTAKGLWDAMCNLFEGNKELKEDRKDLVQRQFDMLNHINGETLIAKIARLDGLVNQLRKLGVVMSDEILVKKLYDSLRPSWSIQCMTIKRLHDLKRITFDEFVVILESYELDAKKREITASGSTEN
jgi:hypothetical protein